MPKLPQGWSLKDVRAAILAEHPDLEPVFETGLGLDLMFLESQVLVAVLLRLIEKGITALPMHDGIMVAESKAEVAMRVMKEEARRGTGYDFPVTRKDIQ